MASFHVDERDEVGCEVDDLFELLGLEFLFGFGSHKEIRQPRPRAAEVPDVNDRSGELNVAHTFAADL